MTPPTRLLTLALLVASVFTMHARQAGSSDDFLKQVLAAFSAKGLKSRVDRGFALIHSHHHE